MSAAFFKYAQPKDDFGHRQSACRAHQNTALRAGVRSRATIVRGWLHAGFNQDEGKHAAPRKVHDGLWPIIAGRRIALNFRWAQPDGVLELYQAGSEGPQWWVPYPDEMRKLPARSILDRCNASKTCPKIIEHFGAAEIWGAQARPRVGRHQRA